MMGYPFLFDESKEGGSSRGKMRELNLDVDLGICRGETCLAVFWLRKGRVNKIAREKVAELMILPWSLDLRVEIDRHILFLVRHIYVHNISLNYFLSASYIEILP